MTGERQAWFPDEPAISKEEMKKQDLIKKNKEALAARKKAMQAQKKEQKDADAKRKLPAGWKRVESRSRPGEYVYENTFTDERQAWFPEEPAAKPLPEVCGPYIASSFKFGLDRFYAGDVGLAQGRVKVVPGRVCVRKRSHSRATGVGAYGACFHHGKPGTAEQTIFIGSGVTHTLPTFTQVTMPTEDQAAAAKAEPAAKNIIAVVKAVYDFTATKPDEEIDMLEGDVIQVEYKADNGWWVGVNTRTKRNGIFPGTYVEDI